MDKSSFTAASVFPKKILISSDIINDVINHKIKPVHIQLNPTNKCPLDCSFCSCKNRNKSIEMTIEYAKHIVYKFYKLGTKAVTLTGGGDPLAYPHLKELIAYMKKLEMVVGLTTNGVLFNNIDKRILDMITWCRVSVSDEQLLPNVAIKNVMNEATDWAFSYVLHKEQTNYDNLFKCIEFANNNNFTHIRLVDDILGENNTMEDVKKTIKSSGIDDSLVIYQGRKKFTRGNSKCLISLLKPNIDPSGNYLPCCGIQYSKKEAVLDFDKNAIMNRVDNIDNIFREQKYFDGDCCDVCYYSEYNDILNILWDGQKTKHKLFV